MSPRMTIESVDSDGFITCPFCGRENRDAWEHDISDGGSTVIECGRCEREFTVTLSVTYTYSSFATAPKSDKPTGAPTP